MSAITLLNRTDRLVVFRIHSGERPVLRPPALAPGASQRIPTAVVHRVVATTEVEGNTYTSAPVETVGAADFVARMVSVPPHSLHALELQREAATRPDRLLLQAETPSSATFVVQREDGARQTVVVYSAGEASVHIRETFSIYAIVDGVTTGTLSTDDPDARIAVVPEPGMPASGDYVLVVE